MGGRRARGLGLLTLAAALGLATPAGAITITIDSFETGTLGAPPPGWTTSGDAVVLGPVGSTTPPINPTDGSQQMLITNFASRGAVSVSQNELDLFGDPNAGIVSGILTGAGLGGPGGPTEGSGLSITFAGQAGDVVEFDWTFLTDEQPPESTYTDFVWVYVEGPGGFTQGEVVAHADQPAGDFVSAAGTPLDWMTSGTHAVTLTGDGTYTITVGIHDVQDAVFDSAAIFDWFRIIRVPEPDTAVLLGIGLLGLAWQGRPRAPRRRRGV